jgi:hypothetical protein
MKTVLSLCVALLTVTPGQAEVFRPQLRRAHGGHVQHHTPSITIGYHSGFRSGFGNYGYGYGRGFGVYSAYRSPGHGYYPGYDAGYYPYASAGYYGTGIYGSGYYSPDYQGSGGAAANGLWLGALAGGIIGRNSGDFRHNGWRILGSVVDVNNRAAASRAQAVVQEAPAYAAPSQPQQPVTIINNYYNAPTTPMSAANALFGR